MKDILNKISKDIFSQYHKAVGSSLLLAGTLVLAGCAHQPQVSKVVVEHNEHVATVLTHGQDIKSQGGRIIKLGETVQIILPEDLLFNPGSANFINSNMSLLNAVAAYMNKYTKFHLNLFI